jgi:hypothetical protein
MAQDQIPAVIDLRIEFLDADGNTIGSEHTVTDLIMPNGARILSYTKIPVGEFLVINTIDGRFESPAIVKGVEVGADYIPRLVLEFTGTSWQQRWIYQEMPKPKSINIHNDELISHCDETMMLLQIIIPELESGQPPDAVFLSELKTSVDELRALIYKAQNEHYR